MNYTVLNDFIERHHSNSLYRKGETYPQDGYKADAKRVEFLQKAHPTYGVPFLDTPVYVKPEEHAAPKKAPVKRPVKAKSGDA